jgi:hypothetical protein
MHDGLYDPAVDHSGTYTYVNGIVCGSYAHIEVMEQLALTWYADVDMDGLGDPGSSTIACHPPPGMVGNSDDECPLVFGYDRLSMRRWPAHNDQRRAGHRLRLYGYREHRAPP